MGKIAFVTPDQATGAHNTPLDPLVDLRGYEGREKKAEGAGRGGEEQRGEGKGREREVRNVPRQLILGCAAPE